MKMERERRVNPAYTEALRTEVVNAVHRGMSYADACSKYGIKAKSTIQGWVKGRGGATSRMKTKKGRNRESDLLIILQKEKRELELALAKMSLKVYCLETVIEEASQHYQEDLKKKFIQQ